MAFVIPSIFTAIDKFTAPVNRMQAAMVGLTTIAGAQGATLVRSLNATSTAAMEVATSAGLIGAAIVVPLALASKAAMDFEKQMTNVATLVDTSRESMSAMGDALLEIASRTPVAIHDLTESLYQIRSAGVSAADAMHVLETSAKLGVAGLSTTTEATKAVTSALVSFKAQGLTADQIANSFFLTVKEGKTKMDALNESFGANAGFVASLGVKLQDFNALTAALTITGQTASDAQNGIAAALVGLEKPTSEMTRIYHNLGIASGKALIDKVGNVGDAIQTVTDAAKAANIEIPKLFSRNALKTVSNITGGASDAYKQNLTEQMAGNDALTTAYQKQLGTTAAQAQIAKNNLETLGIRIGELLLPAVSSLLQAVTPLIKGLSDWAHNHKTMAGIIVKSLAVFGTAALLLAGISFAISTVTKAIWLWKIAFTVFQFSWGILTGLLQGSVMSLGTSSAALNGYTAATWRANTATTALGSTLGTILSTLTGITVVVIALAAYYNKLFKSQAKHDTVKYNNAVNALPGDQQNDFRNRTTYSADQLDSMRAAGVKMGALGIPVMSASDQHYLDSAEAKNPTTDSMVDNFSYQPKNGKDSTTVNLTVNFDKDGKASLTSSGGIPVILNQTGSYNKK